MTKIREAAAKWSEDCWGDSEEQIPAFEAGAKWMAEEAARVAEKHGKNWDSGVGKWASNDISDQIRALAKPE